MVKGYKDHSKLRCVLCVGLQSGSKAVPNTFLMMQSGNTISIHRRVSYWITKLTMSKIKYYSLKHSDLNNEHHH